MQEIWISILVGGIITLVVGLFLGRYWNKTLITELKKENKNFGEKIGRLEKQNIEQKEMLAKSIEAIGVLNKQTKPTAQNFELKKPKKPQGIEKLIKELAIWGAKEWSKKKIHELLYPDEYE